ncbi:MAG: hypothetical protein GYA24_24530 [Candidatus Lokiarchaeota archaeon]|nr:hypothetical protein [Candidatus Lokiarchaeota archaeon]
MLFMGVIAILGCIVSGYDAAASGGIMPIHDDSPGFSCLSNDVGHDMATDDVIIVQMHEDNGGGDSRASAYILGLVVPVAIVFIWEVVERWKRKAL